MNTKYETREAWLEEAVEEMRSLFDDRGYEIPTLRVACGWPSTGGTAVKKRTLGQCWATAASADGITQIFISPYLVDVADVLSTLVHEVCHAVVGTKEKHGKKFRQCAEAVGLEGKMTATVAGDLLMREMAKWITALDAYPHAKLDQTKSGIKKQSTRMIKCECPECGFVVRTTKKWLVKVGAPHCPEHGAMTSDSID